MQDLNIPVSLTKVAPYHKTAHKSSGTTKLKWQRVALEMHFRSSLRNLAVTAYVHLYGLNKQLLVIAVTLHIIRINKQMIYQFQATRWTHKSD